MFANLFGKRLLTTLRSRDTIIWTWVFPIMLSTLFYFTLSTLDSSQVRQAVPAAVVQDQAMLADTTLTAVLDAVSQAGEGQLLNLTKVRSVAEADQLLRDGKVDGYFRMDGTPELVVAQDGMNQTILKSFMDRYLQNKNSAEKLMRENPSAAAELFAQTAFTAEISLTQNPPTEKVSYFYALLAMVCMYGGFQGMASVSYLQANLSPLGARRTMAPIGRFRQCFYDLLAAFAAHFACVLIVVAYIVLVLGVSFGNRLVPILLTCLVGSLMGVSFGTMIASLSRMKEAAKTAIIISVTMICCFLAGLMVSDISYMVAQNLPVLAWLNPAARITDAFYCLYYYDTYDRYLLNIGMLLAMTGVMFGVTAISLRRQRYESI